MDYRVIIYILIVFTTTYALTGINFNIVFKQGKVLEAKIFIILFILALSELVTRFIINFLEVSKIL